MYHRRRVGKVHPNETIGIGHAIGSAESSFVLALFRNSRNDDVRGLFRSRRFCVLWLLGIKARCRLSDGGNPLAAILSPRADAASNLAPNDNVLVGVAGNFAKADGLTAVEASELVAWLHVSGFVSVEVVHDANRCSVRWNR
jgi:hypothetical protein